MGRLGHTLSTLRPVGHPTGRKTRFRLLARLCRVGSLSHWVPPKGFFDASYIAFLLSQAFPGASARRSDQRPEEETWPQLHNSAARHRLREFGRKSLDPCLTIKVVNDTISSCSTFKSLMIRRPRQWP